MFKRLFPAMGAFLFALLAPQAHAYTPSAQQVVGNVYAIIGPLGQRSAENDGLNNNLGFIVTAEGVILIDSGASRLDAGPPGPHLEATIASGPRACQP